MIARGMKGIGRILPHNKVDPVSLQPQKKFPKGIFLNGASQLQLPNVQMLATKNGFPYICTPY